METNGVYESWWGPGPGEFQVVLHKPSYTTIWTYRVRNRNGGSSGSTQRGSLRSVTALALAHMPRGTEYRLIVNGQDRGLHVRGQEDRARVAFASFERYGERGARN